MAISRKTIHKIFEPLVTTVSTVVEGNPSQIYNTLLNEWTPNRSTSPLYIQPKVVATTSSNDKSWANGDHIAEVREGQWYANGIPIGSVESLAGMYTIDTSKTDTNYRLTFKKNLTPGEHYDFVFKGRFADTRNNTWVPVQTDPVPVTVSENAPNEWDLSVVHDTSIKYKPLSDLLKEYDWKVANGIISASDVERNKCLDGNQYELKMPIIISYGSAVVKSSHALWSHLSIHLYICQNGTEILADEVPFVRGLSKEEIVLDQRLIPDGTVLCLKLFFDERLCGSEYLTFSLVIDKYFCDPANEGDYAGTSLYRHDRAICVNKSSGREMKYPEAYLKMEWYTDSQNAIEVYHGEGETIIMEYARINIGSDQLFDVYIKSRIKAQAAALTFDSEGNILITDEDGAVLTADLLLNE